MGIFRRKVKTTDPPLAGPQTADSDTRGVEQSIADLTGGDSAPALVAARLQKTLEVAREQKKLPELSAMIDMLTTVEQLSNYATVVSIALGTAAEYRGVSTRELKDQYMKMWWQWHKHPDEPRYRAEKVIVIAAEAAQAFPHSEIGWTLVACLLVWIKQGTPDKSGNLREVFGDIPTLDEIDRYQAPLIGSENSPRPAAASPVETAQPADKQRVNALMAEIFAIESHVFLSATQFARVDEIAAELSRSGQDAVPWIICQIQSDLEIVRNGPYPEEFHDAPYQQARILCEVIGRIGGSEAYETLTGPAVAQCVLE